MDLGARAARTGIAHLPEIVFAAKSEDALGLSPGFDPKLACLIVRPDLIVALENREPQPPGIEPKLIHQQIPSKVNGVFLKIIAKRKIPQHLKKRMMPRRLAYFVEVIVLTPGAQTLLRSNGPRVVAFLKPKKYVLELIHPSVDK